MVVLLFAGSLLGGCGDGAPRLRSGEPTPAFELPGLSGELVAFPEDLLGQVVAIRFWADWCPFCESEMSSLEPVFQRYREQGLRMLAVNVRQDRKTADDFVARLKISYEVLLDEEGSVARDYGVIGLPTTFVIDRQGRLTTRILGESTPEVIDGILRELL